MFGSEILEVAVGLVLVYLLLSVIATSVREGVEAILKSRAAHLERGIRELLQHDNGGAPLMEEVFNHPMVFALFRGGYTPLPAKDASWADRMKTKWKQRKLPSYIPARSFASALLDIAAQKTVAAGAMPPNARVDLSAVRATLDEMEGVPDSVKAALRHAIDSAEGNLERTRKNVEAWYDSAMDRVSGWYKRQTQWIILAIALVLTVGLNANTLTIADDLYRNGDARRAILVEAAKRTDTRGPSGAAGDSTAADRAYAEVVNLHLPIGRPYHVQTWRQGVQTAFGLALTTFAILLGAPFWFDVLNKVMIVRSTVKPHQKSPEASSDDRQRVAPEDLATTVAAVATATTHAMRGVSPPADFVPPVTTGTTGTSAAPAPNATPTQ